MDRNPRAIGTPAATNRPQNPSKPDFIVQLVGQARLFVSAITSRRRLIGTFWLVLGGCGSAVISGTYPQYSIGIFGIAIAFGLTIVTMAYAIGNISGCHLNPAVSIGLWASGRFPANKLLPYIVSQVIGGIIAGGVLYLIASGKEGFDVAKGFAANGYSDQFFMLSAPRPAVPDEVVMLGNASGSVQQIVWTSTDGGATWTSMPNTADVFGTAWAVTAPGGLAAVAQPLPPQVAIPSRLATIVG